MHRILVVLVAACSQTAQPAPSIPGTWTRDAGTGETQRLVLFETGTLAFMEVGEKLPISRTFGRWSMRGETMEIDVAGTEPETGTFPIARRAVAKIDAKTHALMLDGVAWTQVRDPYGTSAGADERRASDERGWRSLVDRAAAP